MPFKFAYVCDLLQKLEDDATRDPPLLPRTLQTRAQKAIVDWFKSHRARLDAHDTCDAAVLAALFPERRTDRVFGLREKSLVKLLGRVLGLSIQRQTVLTAWEQPGNGDLGLCVERVQRQAEMPIPLPGRAVTVEEVDAALADLASRCRFSSPAVRANVSRSNSSTERSFISIFHRLQSRDAKWCTRLLLKSHLPVILPEHITLRQYHFLLPDLLRFQSDLEVATGLLRGPVIDAFPARPPSAHEEVRLREAAAQEVVPRVGVKVGRVPHLKARSIKHCLQLAAGRKMSLERKYDGEYCQIHINLSRPQDCIQIFSKSGKDSTDDRRAIHRTIHDCLRIGQDDCIITRNCILEGELVVFSDLDDSILEFHKLRKHLTRSGAYIGNQKDSQPHDHEHLMMIFFDVLLLDDSPLLVEDHDQRMGWLHQLIHTMPGRAELAHRQIIYFSRRKAADDLSMHFAHGITSRWEGFVLKPCDQPYFTLQPDYESPPNAWIKLKKDYIVGLGDTADFAVVGAGYDGNAARSCGIKGLKWTHFHVACMTNKPDVLRFGKKPCFRVLEALNYSIKPPDLKTLNQLGQFRAENFDQRRTFDWYDVQIETGLSCRMTVMFREPFVFEVMGAGFDKPSGSNAYMLRFPRVLKIHWDRTSNDTVSFQELQEMADEARNAPIEGASAEEKQWVEKLEGCDPGRRAGKRKRWSTSEESLRSTTASERTEESLSPLIECNTSRAAPLIRVDTSDLTAGHSDAQPKDPEVADRPRLRSSRISAPVDVLVSERSSAGPADATEGVNLPKKRKATDDSGSSPGRVKKTARREVPSTHGQSSEMQARAYSTESSAPEALKDITNASPKRPRRTTPSTATPQAKMSSSRRATNQIIAGGSTTILPTPPEAAAPPPTRRLEQSSIEVSTLPLPPESPFEPLPRFEDCLLSNAANPCAFRDTTVLLSPCVAGMVYLTDTLLPNHGVPFTASISHFLKKHMILSSTSSSLSRLHDFTPPPTAEPPPPRRIKHIILVESHRPHPTALFLRDLRKAGLAHRGLQFFDWRVLELVSKAERKRKLGRRGDEPPSMEEEMKGIWERMRIANV